MKCGGHGHGGHVHEVSGGSRPKLASSTDLFGLDGPVMHARAQAVHNSLDFIPHGPRLKHGVCGGSPQ